MGVIVDLIIIAIVALSTYLAIMKIKTVLALVALAIKLCAVVISIVITLLLYKPVSNLIINTTSIDETIQNAILEKATDVIRQDEESDLSNEVIDFAKDGVLDVKARELSIQIVNTGVIIILFLIIKFLLRFVTVIANKIAKNHAVKKMSAQAVGGAVGHNEISIIIPCHRVVGSNGSLTGYAGGIEKKAALHKLEHTDMSHFFIPKKGTAL